MKSEALGTPYLPPLGRLLGGWRDILDDIRRLGAGLNALPDSCACGDAQSHLRGSCACCHAIEGQRRANCPDCQAILVDLRCQIDELAVDTLRFFPVMKISFSAPHRELARAEGNEVEHGIAQVLRIFDRLTSAIDDFQRGCPTSQLAVVKEAATDLLAAATGLNLRLKDMR